MTVYRQNGDLYTSTTIHSNKKKKSFGYHVGGMIIKVLLKCLHTCPFPHLFSGSLSSSADCMYFSQL